MFRRPVFNALEGRAPLLSCTNISVGLPSCPARPRRPAVRRLVPTRSGYVRVLDSTNHAKHVQEFNFRTTAYSYVRTSLFYVRCKRIILMLIEIFLFRIEYVFSIYRFLALSLNILDHVFICSRNALYKMFHENKYGSVWVKSLEQDTAYCRIRPDARYSPAYVPFRF